MYPEKRLAILNVPPLCEACGLLDNGKGLEMDISSLCRRGGNLKEPLVTHMGLSVTKDRR